MWRPSLQPHTNLNLLQPFIILIMRDWKGGAALKWLNQSVHAQSQCEMCRDPCTEWTTRVTQKSWCGGGYTWWNQIPTLHNHSSYFHWQLEGMRCCELPESVQRYSIWMQKVRMGQANFHSERLHSKNTSNFGPTKDFAMVSISKA